MIYVEDTISDEIMDTARSIFQVKALYCKEKGLDPKEVVNWCEKGSETDSNNF